MLPHDSPARAPVPKPATFQIDPKFIKKPSLPTIATSSAHAPLPQSLPSTSTSTPVSTTTATPPRVLPPASNPPSAKDSASTHSAHSAYSASSHVEEPLPSRFSSLKHAQHQQPANVNMNDILGLFTPVAGAGVGGFGGGFGGGGSSSSLGSSWSNQPGGTSSWANQAFPPTTSSSTPSSSSSPYSHPQSLAPPPQPASAHSDSYFHAFHRADSQPRIDSLGAMTYTPSIGSALPMPAGGGGHARTPGSQSISAQQAAALMAASGEKGSLPRSERSERSGSEKSLPRSERSVQGMASAVEYGSPYPDRDRDLPHRRTGSTSLGISRTPSNPSVSLSLDAHDGPASSPGGAFGSVWDRIDSGESGSNGGGTSPAPPPRSLHLGQPVDLARTTSGTLNGAAAQQPVPIPVHARRPSAPKVGSGSSASVGAGGLPVNPAPTLPIPSAAKPHVPAARIHRRNESLGSGSGVLGAVGEEKNGGSGLGPHAPLGATRGSPQLGQSALPGDGGRDGGREPHKTPMEGLLKLLKKPDELPPHDEVPSGSVTLGGTIGSRRERERDRNRPSIGVVTKEMIKGPVGPASAGVGGGGDDASRMDSGGDFGAADRERGDRERERERDRSSGGLKKYPSNPAIRNRRQDSTDDGGSGGGYPPPVGIGGSRKYSTGSGVLRGIVGGEVVGEEGRVWGGGSGGGWESDTQGTGGRGTRYERAGSGGWGGAREMSPAAGWGGTPGGDSGRYSTTSRRNTDGGRGRSPSPTGGSASEVDRWGGEVFGSLGRSGRADGSGRERDGRDNRDNRPSISTASTYTVSTQNSTGSTSSSVTVRRAPSPGSVSVSSSRRRVGASSTNASMGGASASTPARQAPMGYSAADLERLPPVPYVLRECVGVIEEVGMDQEGLYRIAGSVGTANMLKMLFEEMGEQVKLHAPPPRDGERAGGGGGGLGNSSNAGSGVAGGLMARLRGQGRKSSSVGTTPPAGTRAVNIVAAMSAGQMPTDPDEYARMMFDGDVHVLTAVVKRVCTEGFAIRGSQGKEPVTTFALYDRFLALAEERDYRQKMISLQDLVHTLPPLNFAVLKFICEHLKRVSEMSPRNLMTSKNLAIVFGPGLLQSRGDAQMPRPPASASATPAQPKGRSRVNSPGPSGSTTPNRALPVGYDESFARMIRDTPRKGAVVEFLIDYAEWVFGPIEFEEEDELAGSVIGGDLMMQMQMHMQAQMALSQMQTTSERDRDRGLTRSNNRSRSRARSQSRSRRSDRSTSASEGGWVVDAESTGRASEDQEFVEEVPRVREATTAAALAGYSNSPRRSEAGGDEADEYEIESALDVVEVGSGRGSARDSPARGTRASRGERSDRDRGSGSNYSPAPRLRASTRPSSSNVATGASDDGSGVADSLQRLSAALESGLPSDSNPPPVTRQLSANKTRPRSLVDEEEIASPRSSIVGNLEDGSLPRPASAGSINAPQRRPKSMGETGGWRGSGVQ